ncbi:PREDICTED: uncharacterized protein LOC108446513 [Corvus brachyrhynchos]|uniref:uncharacterized protein LOC108446513 n=1 Tax=Corvus brachyrhynchos TaxID=85066 RepID=UPI00081640FF|nr:PREDICTED: uncharacterized protein LOC108446513 [Corvus brachyrhynchos]
MENQDSKGIWDGEPRFQRLLSIPWESGMGSQHSRGIWDGIPNIPEGSGMGSQHSRGIWDGIPNIPKGSGMGSQHSRGIRDGIPNIPSAFPGIPTAHSLLQFLRESLAAIPEKSWICPLVSEMFRQLRGSDGSQLEKNFLYRSMGTALGACPSKELVRKQLQELLENARYREEAEREGLASCFGICARDHLEETLEKLEEFLKSDVFKKSLGLFSIFKDRSEAEPEKLRSGLVLCSGRVGEAAESQCQKSQSQEIPIPEILIREIPIPEFPSREIPIPEIPIREILIPEFPIPGIPVPEIQIPGIPFPGNPNPRKSQSQKS